MFHFFATKRYAQSGTTGSFIADKAASNGSLLSFLSLFSSVVLTQRQPATFSLSELRHSATLAVNLTHFHTNLHKPTLPKMTTYQSLTSTAAMRTIVLCALVLTQSAWRAEAMTAPLGPVPFTQCSNTNTRKLRGTANRELNPLDDDGCETFMVCLHGDITNHWVDDCDGKKNNVGLCTHPHGSVD